MHGRAQTFSEQVIENMIDDSRSGVSDVTFHTAPPIGGLSCWQYIWYLSDTRIMHCNKFIKYTLRNNIEWLVCYSTLEYTRSEEKKLEQWQIIEPWQTFYLDCDFKADDFRHFNCKLLSQTNVKELAEPTRQSNLQLKHSRKMLAIWRLGIGQK